MHLERGSFTELFEGGEMVNALDSRQDNMALRQVLSDEGDTAFLGGMHFCLAAHVYHCLP